MSNFKIILTLVLRDKLPMELIKYIYEEFFEANFAYQQLITAINCEESQKLNFIPLFNCTQRIFYRNRNNLTIIPYICKNNKIFNTFYIDHYIKHIKHFKKMNIDHSFIACILMSLYH
jgi:hypothetical protein